MAHRIDDVRRVLGAASRAAETGLYVAGFIAYEAAAAFDPAFRTRPPSTPLVWMGAYRNPEPVPTPPVSLAARSLQGSFAYVPDRYAACVEAIRNHIREGEVYQVNFTGPYHVTVPAQPLGLFEALLSRQPVPYAAYVDTGELQVLSCSPELFFERRGRAVATRPMKGTVRRGKQPQEDEALQSWLRDDAKSRAENLMIVDLLRNDLSKCCVPGSVRVEELFATERYETVIQMVSEVRGRLRDGTSTLDVFDALYPCGSVTGAPKIRAMELIERYEAAPRGVYCGAVGLMHGDRAIFNVAIRTLTLRGRSGTLGIGSGIVWDSDASSEFDECVLKARFLTGSDDSVLIETMLAEEGKIPLLERHASRLRRSAESLDFPLDEEAFRRQVAAATPTSGRHKIRATLARSGTIDVTVSRFEPGPGELLVTVSAVRIRSDDPRRGHKTSDRTLYDTEYARAQRRGYDEVIFLNERDEVAEGSRTNVLVVVGGRWLTPPVASGALPGVYRAHLMASRRVEERVITVDELRTADRIFLCNAVAGLVPAWLELAPDDRREDVRADRHEDLDTA